MIGVVGDGPTAAQVAQAFRAASATVETGAGRDIVERQPSHVVAVGEKALVDLVSAGVDAPVLAVDLGPGLPAVAPDSVAAAAEALVEGTYRTSEHDLLAVDSAGERLGEAVFEAMLVRSQPGRISEYELDAGAARSRFRADGVVVGTPAGSHGYAAAAGAPRLGLDVEAVVVVPVAAFGLGAPDWVLDPAEGVGLTVARDEGDVSVLLDGRERSTLAGRATVSVSPGRSLETVEPPGR